jgi:trafficking protein particle complex subunit 9
MLAMLNSRIFRRSRGPPQVCIPPLPLSIDILTNSPAVFSPESFPDGMILFDFNSSAPPASHVGLVPFELFREPMIIVGIGDAQEYPDWNSDSRKEEFSALINDLRDKYTRTLIHRVFLFNEAGVEHVTTSSYGVVQLPPSATGEKVCAELALTFLDEVASYAKSILPLPSIASPTVPQDQMIQARYSTDDIPSLIKQGSQNGTSRSSTPGVDHKELHRMSMPVLPSIDSTRRNESPIRAPRTFEEMNMNTLNSRNDNAPTKPSKLRPGSMAVSREGSQDRVSVYGFGSDSFNEKARSKGRGRVGVVLASVFLQAGRWHDALREAIESGHKARAMSDHIWHAKALEIIALCMILLAWSGFEFPVSVY